MALPKEMSGVRLLQILGNRSCRKTPNGKARLLGCLPGGSRAARYRALLAGSHDSANGSISNSWIMYILRPPVRAARHSIARKMLPQQNGCVRANPAIRVAQNETRLVGAGKRIAPQIHGTNARWVSTVPCLRLERLVCAEKQGFSGLAPPRGRDENDRVYRRVRLRVPSVGVARRAPPAQPYRPVP